MPFSCPADSGFEPVFANVRAQKSLHRFTLRGKTKVNVQWKLYCLVHNLEKLEKMAQGGTEGGCPLEIRPSQPAEGLQQRETADWD